MFKVQFSAQGEKYFVMLSSNTQQARKYFYATEILTCILEL